MSAEKAMEQIRALAGQLHIPSMSIVILQEGKTVVDETFGAADIANDLPASRDTFYYISSCTKAFTTLLCAMAVEEGLIQWDRPLRYYGLGFRLWDDDANEIVTLRDMACHRTGLPRHDLFSAAQSSRLAYFHNIRYLRPSFEIREKYSYQNQIYVAIGVILEKLYHKSWECLVAEKIARPLGMEIRFRGPEAIDSRVARPYETDLNGCRPTRYNLMQIDNPCGGILLTPAGMEKWLHFLIGGGAPLVGSDAFAELCRGVVPTGAVTEDGSPVQYALGWQESTVNGKTQLAHGGANTGFTSQIAFFPQEKTGYAILTNSIGVPITAMAAAILDDALTGTLRADYLGRFQAKYLPEEQPPAKEIKHVPPPGDPTNFTGVYHDKGYGTAEIIQTDNRLSLLYYGAEYALEHITSNHYRTVLTFGMKGTLHFVTDVDARCTGLWLEVIAGNTARVLFTKQEGVNHAEY